MSSLKERSSHRLRPSSPLKGSWFNKYNIFTGWSSGQASPERIKRRSLPCAKGRELDTTSAWPLSLSLLETTTQGLDWTSGSLTRPSDLFERLLIVNLCCPTCFAHFYYYTRPEEMEKLSHCWQRTWPTNQISLFVRLVWNGGSKFVKITIPLNWISIQKDVFRMDRRVRRENF